MRVPRAGIVRPVPLATAHVPPLVTSSVTSRALMAYVFGFCDLTVPPTR